MIKGKVDTNRVINEYLSAYNKDYTVKIRGQIDKPQLYQYEEEIGKQIFYMNADEITELIFRLIGNDSEFAATNTTFDFVVSLLRNVFQYYSSTYEPVYNPLSDKRFKGRNIAKILKKDKKLLSWDYVQTIIEKMHVSFDPEMADYYELVLRLFHEGFYDINDIISLKEDMINFRKHEVKLYGRVLKLSLRTYKLLLRFHDANRVEGYRKDYVLSSWNGSYFKFVIREGNLDKFNDKPKSKINPCINRIFERINGQFNAKLNYHSMFWLGFYDFICSKYGKLVADEIIISERDNGKALLLEDAMREYGVKIELPRVKRYLLIFVSK